MNTMGIGVGDVDRDGRLDLALSNIGGNRLLRNAGNGTFTDVAGAYGVARPWQRTGRPSDHVGRRVRRPEPRRLGRPALRRGQHQQARRRRPRPAARPAVRGRRHRQADARPERAERRDRRRRHEGRGVRRLRPRRPHGRLPRRPGWDGTPAAQRHAARRHPLARGRPARVRRARRRAHRRAATHDRRGRLRRHERGLGQPGRRALRARSGPRASTASRSSGGRGARPCSATSPWTGS